MATSKKEKVFKLKLAPYRDPVTMKLMGESSEVEIYGVDAAPKYGENDGDLSLFVIVDSSGAQVFSCPLERVIECVSQRHLVKGKSRAVPKPVLLTRNAV